MTSRVLTRIRGLALAGGLVMALATAAEAQVSVQIGNPWGTRYGTTQVSPYGTGYTYSPYTYARPSVTRQYSSYYVAPGSTVVQPGYTYPTAPAYTPSYYGTGRYYTQPSYGYPGTYGYGNPYYSSGYNYGGGRVLQFGPVQIRTP